MNRLALLGASGHGKVVAETAQASGWGSVIFFDDAWPHVTANGHWPVVGNTTELLARISEFDGVLVAIGNCAIRLQKQHEFKEHGANIVTVVHPRACVSDYATLGAGTVVMAGAIINVDAVIGSACIINTGASVDHDCILGDGVHVSPGAHLSGGVTVGKGSWIGVGSAVRQLIQIGTGVIVGAGAVVVSHVVDGQTVVGNPARPMPKR